MNPWVVGGLLAVGWGPLFLADIVSETRFGESIDQHYVMAWGMSVTFFCSALATALILIHIVRLVCRLVSRIFGWQIPGKPEGSRRP